MPKGCFTQGVAVLLRSPVTIEEIERCLNGFDIACRREASVNSALNGASIMLGYKPEINGYVDIDIVNRTWPDEMGNPKGSDEDVELLSAWSMGFFGPFAFPGNLERAIQQSWSWQEAGKTAALHTAFLRIRSSYAFGLEDENTPLIPADYQPIPELIFITKVARALLDLPEALCYFNPNGECLAQVSELDSMLERHEDSGLLPLNIWSNVRLFRLPDIGQLLMDTVGMQQLDATDHEAIFPEDAFEPDEVANFLWNAAAYIVENGPVVKDGHTMDGPLDLPWRCQELENSALPPPREVLRWTPPEMNQSNGGLMGRVQNWFSRRKKL